MVGSVHVAAPSLRREVVALNDVFIYIVTK
jgi:hypothetical protein